ncbi:MAG: hypothetical protein JWM56_470 [Candidatus Peribacteria bacterium]|nr:hypothetical protein [Candidatus Peribacteria bacterium]
MIHPEKFKGKYRISSTRLIGRDYGLPGRYFITICTKYRAPWFGVIRHGIMGLSDAGCMVHDYWNQIPIHYPHVSIDSFIVMPDHIHGIIRIHGQVETPYYGVSTGQRMDWKPGTLGVIIHQFKRACTKYIRQSGMHDFTWQPRFHDRIIRNDHAYERISAYIVNNPRNSGGGI